jgi:hypothetical protein
MHHQVQREKGKTGRSSKDVPKGMQSTTKLQKVVPKGAQRKFSAQKSFLRECRSLQRKINADSAEVKGEEAPKGGLQRKINADSAEVKG